MQDNRSLTIGDIAELMLGPGGLVDGAFNSNEPNKRAQDYAQLQDALSTVELWRSNPDLDIARTGESILLAVDYRANIARRQTLRDMWDKGEPIEAPANAVFWTRKTYSPEYQAMNPAGYPARLKEIQGKWQQIWDAGDAATVSFGAKNAQGGRTATLRTPDGKSLDINEPWVENYNPFDPAHIRLNNIPYPVDTWLDPTGMIYGEMVAAGKSDQHSLGIRGHPSIGSNVFDQDGKVLGPVRRTRNMILPDPDGFYVSKKVADRDAPDAGPEAARRYMIQHGDIKVVDGKKFVGVENDLGIEDVPLYDLRQNNRIQIPLGDGSKAELNVTDEWLYEMRNSFQGGKLGDSITGKIYRSVFHDGEMVDTPYGRMLVVKVTGNVERDRELMRDPLWLRSIAESFGDQGPLALTTFTQAVTNVGEYTASYYAGGALLKGSGAALRGVGTKLADKAPLLTTPARIAEVMSRSVLLKARPLTAPVVRFNAEQFIGQIWYEGLRGAITGQGDAADWVKSGYEQSKFQFGVNLMTRGMGKLSRMAAVGPLGRALRVDSWARRLNPNQIDAFMGSEARVAMRSFASDVEQRTDLLIGGLRSRLSDEALKTLRTKSLAELFHSGFSGFFIGGYLEAQKVAAADGKDWMSLPLEQKKDYYQRAFSEGMPWAHAVAFMSAQAAYLPLAMRGESKRSRAQIDNALEVFKSQLDSMRTSHYMGGLIEALDVANATHGKIREATQAFLKESEGASLAALDEDHPSPQNIDTLGSIIQTPGGRRRLEKALTILSDADLDRLYVESRSQPTVPQGIAERLGVREALEGEIARRLGAPSDRKLRVTKGRTYTLAELPRGKWPAFFDYVLLDSPEGKVDAYNLRGGKLRILASKDEKGEPIWRLVTKGGQRSVATTTFPRTIAGLHDAMGKMLERARVLDLQVLAAEAALGPKVPPRAVQEEPQPGQRDTATPIPTTEAPPAKTEELSSDDIRLAEALAYSLDEGQRLATERAQVMLAEKALPPEPVREDTSGTPPPPATVAGGEGELADAIRRSGRTEEHERVLLEAVARAAAPEPAPIPRVQRSLSDEFGVGAEGLVEAGRSFWMGAERDIHEARAADMLSGARSRALGAAGKADPGMDAHTLGMLAGVGGRADIVAGATGADVARVQAVWDRAVKLGEQAGSKVESALDALAQRFGAPLLTAKQLKDPATLELLSVMAVMPPSDWRRSAEGRGTAAQGEKLVKAMDRQADAWKSAMAQEIRASGMSESQASAVANAAFLAARQTAESYTHPGTVPDLYGRIASKVGQAVPGLNHRSSLSAKSEKGFTLGEMTDALIEAIGGSAHGLRTGNPRTLRLDIATPEGETVSLGDSLGARQIAGQADIAARGALYAEASRTVRRILNALADVEVDGVPLVAQPDGGAMVAVKDAMAWPLFPTVMRQLAADSPELRSIVEGQTRVPWDELVHMAQATLRAERFTLLDSIADPASRNQVETVWQALAWQDAHPGERLPDDVRTKLGQATALFPDGVLDPHGTQVSEFAQYQLTDLWYESLVNTRQALLEDGRIEDAEELAGIEPVPFFSGVPPISQPRAVRRHVLYEAGLGALFSNKGRGWLRTFTDWVVSRPAFDSETGRKLGRSLVQGWYGPIIDRVLRVQSSGLLPTSVARGNRALRNIREAAGVRMQRFQEDASLAMSRMAEDRLSIEERRLMGWAIDNDAFTRLSHNDFVKRFGSTGERIWSTGLRWIGILDRLGEEGVKNGWLEEGARRELAGRYFPWQKILGSVKHFDPEAPVSGYRGSARLLPRAGDESGAENVQIELDAALALPPTVWIESNINRVWEVLRESAADPSVLVSSKDYESMPGPLKFFYRKAYEPRGGKKYSALDLSEDERALPPAERADLIARRQGADAASVKLAAWLDREVEFMGRAQDTKVKRDIIARLQDGYMSRQNMKEIELLLEESTPSEPENGLDRVMRQLTTHWRAVKTFRRPEHWWLQGTSGPLLAAMTGRVTLGQFIHSVATGKGIPAEASRHIWDHYQWLEAGKPELDPLSPRSARIKQVGEFMQMTGHSSLVQSVFDSHTANDVLVGMYRTSGIDRMVESEMRLSPETLRAFALGMARSGNGLGAFDAIVSELTTGGTQDQALALGSLYSLYHHQEYYWKYTAYLEGLRRGMKPKEAAEWAVAANGDIGERNPLLQRFSGNYTAHTSDLTKVARARMGKPTTPNAVAQLGRYAKGSPFWVWRSVMYPACIEGILRYPLRFVATASIMRAGFSAIQQMWGGNDENIRNAMAGHGEWSNTTYSDESVELAKKHYGELGFPNPFGGVLQGSKLRAKHHLDIMRALFTSPAYSRIEGPSVGGITRGVDISQMMQPGPGEMAEAVRSLSSLIQGGDSRENLNTFEHVTGWAPITAAALATDVWQAIAGVDGETRAETATKAAVQFLRDWVPETSPAYPISSTGIDWSRNILFGGDSISDIAASLPSPQAQHGMAGDLGVQAFGMLTPMRNAPTGKAQGLQTSPLESVLRGAGLIPKEPALDAFEGELSVVQRSVRRAIGNQLLGAYRNYISEDNTIPLALLKQGALDSRMDFVIENGQVVDVIDRPSTPIGTWLRSQGKTRAERRSSIDEYVKVMSDAGPVLDSLMDRIANRRQVPPEVFARVLSGALAGQDSHSSMLSWLDRATREGAPSWTKEYEGEFYRMWFDTGLDRMAPTGTGSRQAWERVNAWIESRRTNPPMGYGARTFHPALLDAPMGEGLDLIEERPTTFGSLLEALR